MDYKDYVIRKDGEAMHCWFRAKLGLISTLLNLVYTGKSESRKILDIGAGTGTELDVVKKFGHTSAFDIEEKALEIAKEKGVETILGNIETYDLGEKRYDAVCCFDIFEHLEKDELVMEKICRTLKDDGRLIFTVPAYNWLFSSHDIALEHKRRYGKREIVRKLKKAGFEFEAFGSWNMIMFPVVFAVRVVKIFIRVFVKDEKPSAESKALHPILNNMLYWVMSLDNVLIKRGMKLPFGLSIYGVCKKK